jgi:general secretion pathway protein J
MPLAFVHRQFARSRSLGAPRLAGGFTLIEVMVSMLILAVLATTAWKGIDAISSARKVADENLQQTLRLQSVMTQFDADMAQAVDTQTIPAGAMQFDGANLRMMRRDRGGVRVVVWFLRRDRLMRWASPIAEKSGELEKYWMSGFQLRGREAGTLAALKGVQQFQVYCFRAGSLSNCQSTGTVQKVPQPSPTPNPYQPLPQALRCQIAFGEGSGFTGKLSRDVMVAPQVH